MKASEAKAPSPALKAEAAPPGDQNAPPAEPPAEGAAATAPPAEDPGPTGPGWVIQLRGHHFHNKRSEGVGYVRDTLIKNLRETKIKLVDKDGKPEELTLKELGIGYPTVVFQTAEGNLRRRDSQSQL